ncbi:glycosyltransferase family 2 protein [Candidatus Kuenenia sp.]|uniref:glycosyltransferase family 2 protein n=1 Tax=Candidatus Kuenenia sp. TaxID=2499824 RepID=UPI00321F6B5E
MIDEWIEMRKNEKLKNLVAIPVFNESDAYDIIQRVKKVGVEVLALDDGSTNDIDSSLKYIQGIHVIRHQRNLGYGQTIIDAFNFAINNDYDYLVTIDADGQHEPEEIPQFLSKMPFRDYDILSGSRYLLPVNSRQEVPHDRYRINMAVTQLLNDITGFQLTDAFCGFKAYKVQKLKNLILTEPGYGMPVQLWIQAWKAGLEVRELPVKLIYKDLTKRFHGNLANAETRLEYYKKIIETELDGKREREKVANFSNI